MIIDVGVLAFYKQQVKKHLDPFIQWQTQLHRLTPEQQEQILSQIRMCASSNTTDPQFYERIQHQCLKAKLSSYSFLETVRLLFAQSFESQQFNSQALLKCYICYAAEQMVRYYTLENPNSFQMDYRESENRAVVVAKITRAIKRAIEQDFQKVSFPLPVDQEIWRIVDLQHTLFMDEQIGCFTVLTLNAYLADLWKNGVEEIPEKQEVIDNITNVIKVKFSHSDAEVFVKAALFKDSILTSGLALLSWKNKGVARLRRHIYDNWQEVYLPCGREGLCSKFKEQLRLVTYENRPEVLCNQEYEEYLEEAVTRLYKELIPSPFPIQGLAPLDLDGGL